MYYLSSGGKERLFSGDPGTHTCCRERTDDEKLVVGDFSSAGPRIYRHFRDWANDDVGVALLRKF